LIVSVTNAIIPTLIKRNDMKPYELTYLIIPSFTTQEASVFHEEIKKTISKNGGVLGSEQIPTRKTLAYPIKKSTEGYLSSIDFDASPEDAKKVAEEVKKEKNILRHILIGKQFGKKIDEEPRRKRRSLKPEKAKLQEIDEKIDEIL
jgi:small subunit ribosomal protein S6